MDPFILLLLCFSPPSLIYCLTHQTEEQRHGKSFTDWYSLWRMSREIIAVECNWHVLSFRWFTPLKVLLFFIQLRRRGLLLKPVELPNTEVKLESKGICYKLPCYSALNCDRRENNIQFPIPSSGCDSKVGLFHFAVWGIKNNFTDNFFLPRTDIRWFDIAGRILHNRIWWLPVASFWTERLRIQYLWAPFPLSPQSPTSAIDSN